MKTVFILLAALGISAVVNAQYRDTIFVIPKLDAHDFISLPLLIQGGKFSVENKVDQVQVLPIDNMPCLVPGITNTTSIPTKKLFLQKGSIPNGSPR
jgi:hypothetical protein